MGWRGYLMNDDKLKMLKREMRIRGQRWLIVQIVKPAVFFYSESYPITFKEGGEDAKNRRYINGRAKRSIDCYGITNAGLLMEAMVVDKEYLFDEPWDVIAYTDFIEICTLNPVGNIKKSNRNKDRGKLR
jgi:hypothetical protein